MDVKWHIAFCNVTYTEYAGVKYRDYHDSPAVMLETQLKAKDVAEERWGVGRFMHPAIDLPSCAFPSLFGMSIIVPDEDELPYLDNTHPPIPDVAQAPQITIGDPKTTGWMARRWEFWQYYKSQGYNVGLGGYGGGIITTACELTNSAVFAGFYDNPDAAQKVLDKVMEAEVRLATLDAQLQGRSYSGFTYTGDDYAGLMSPALFRKFAVPAYLRLHGDNKSRFMHSELLRAEHLRIARDEVGITDFHGAGCKNLTLSEMYEIMGENFWTQITPQEMLEFTPAQLEEKIKEYAECGCRYVQLYPGRQTPAANMEAAIAACQKHCLGGPA
ncbi:MAG: uroporphyrinogen decarboxylase family protein [Armatimonadota bacterium]